MSAPSLTAEQQATYYQSRQPALYGTLISLLVISNVAVISKLWCNYQTHWKRQGLLVEDVFIALSGILITAVLATLIDATRYGLGLHIWRVNAEDPDFPSHLAHIFRDCWITMVLMCAFFTCVKLSLLFFYRRLFLVTKKWLKIAWWINLVYVILWFIGGTGYYLFQCWPVEWYWLQYYQRFKKHVPGDADGTCGARSPVHVAMPMMFSLVSDIALLLLPLGAISTLKVSRKKKIGLIGVFGVGVIACLLELARILEMSMDTDDTNDPSWGVAIFVCLTASEETAAVVCACLPVIVPHLWRSHRERTQSKATALYGSNEQNTHNGRTRREGSGFFRLGSSRPTVRGDDETLISPGRAFFHETDKKFFEMDVTRAVTKDTDSERTDHEEKDNQAVDQVYSPISPVHPLSPPGDPSKIRVRTDIQVNVANRSV